MPVSSLDGGPEKLQVTFSRGDGELFRNDADSIVSSDQPGLRKTLRSGVTLADVVVAPSLSAPTVADLSASGTGSLVAHTTYYSAYSVNSPFGNTPCSGAASGTTSNNSNDTHGVRLTIPQATVSAPSGAVPATYTYDVFLSTDVAPKKVGRITEAQRAAGGTTITAVNVVGSGGPGAAGTVDIYVPGTGIQTNNAAFLKNTAYHIAGMSPYPVTAKTLVEVEVAVTDLSVTPELIVVPFLDSVAGKAITPPLTVGDNDICRGEFVLPTADASLLVLAVDTVLGDGATVKLKVQPGV